MPKKNDVMAWIVFPDGKILAEVRGVRTLSGVRSAIKRSSYAFPTGRGLRVRVETPLYDRRRESL